MKVCMAVVAIIISLLSGWSAHAATVACGTASYTSYEALGADGCTIGDKTFSNFDFSFANFDGSITVTPFLDNPSTAYVGDIGFSLTIAGLVQVGPGAMDIGLVYDVAAPGATITDAHLGFGGAATGSGIALVSETVCPFGDASCQTLALLVFQTAAGGENADFIEFDAVQGLHIRKDIGVFVPQDATGLATITLVDQSFTQTVPEPATMFLLGSGLVGIGVAGRRRLRKK